MVLGPGNGDVGEQEQIKDIEMTLFDFLFRMMTYGCHVHLSSIHAGELDISSQASSSSWRVASGDMAANADDLCVDLFTILYWLAFKTVQPTRGKFVWGTLF